MNIRFFIAADFAGQFVQIQNIEICISIIKCIYAGFAECVFSIFRFGIRRFENCKSRPTPSFRALPISILLNESFYRLSSQNINNFSVRKLR